MFCYLKRPLTLQIFVVHICNANSNANGNTTENDQITQFKKYSFAQQRWFAKPFQKVNKI